MGPITTSKKLCRKCYACIRNCPVKAIKVEEESTEVIHDRCIGCGNCLRSCSQQAKQIADCIAETEQMLRGDHPVIAVLGCSFPAFFSDVTPGQLSTGLKRLGFAEVHEGTQGVDLIAADYQSLMDDPPSTPLISTHCPSIVDLIERHHPQLLKHLMPVVSPMIAIGRFIKQNFPGEVKVIYISSCIAGKFETISEPVAGAVDTVLTYQELSLMFRNRSIELKRLTETNLDGIPPREGRIFPVAGGPLRALGVKHDLSDVAFISTEGESNVLEVIHDLAAGRIQQRVVDLCFCTGGCIGGPGKNNRLTTFSKRNLICSYDKNPTATYVTAEHYRRPERPSSTRRTFNNKLHRLPQPSGDSIRRILNATNKHRQQDELNCGACGYPTCREHAVATYQGLAEIPMCLPHLITDLEADRTSLAQKYELARRMLDQEVGDATIIGDDPRTKEVLNLIRQVGPTPTTVLIRGESGTGKELTARAIHDHSHRADKPLVTVNCTTLTDSLLESELFGHRKGAFTGAMADKKGLFEAANGGTIFLDEIGDITPKLQAELLRVLDNGEIRRVGDNSPRKVDVRLIAATNKNLEEGVRSDWFREDLFYRLNVFSLHIPPLRNRLESLPELINHFLARVSRRLNKTLLGIDEQARDAMLRYHWPGNIRELQNIIERAAVLSRDDIIRLENLPVIFSELRKPERPTDGASAFKGQRDRQLGQIETNLLRRYLEETGGNVTEAARRAEIPRRTFYRLLNRHGLQSRDFKISN